MAKIKEIIKNWVRNEIIQEFWKEEFKKRNQKGRLRVYEIDGWMYEIKIKFI